jgi:hypothetical protein
MLQDKFLPVFQFQEKHRIVIATPKELIYPLIENFDFRDSWLIKLLFTLRGLTDDMTVKKGLLRNKFIELERNDDEVILGLVGQFWKPDGNLKDIAAADFTGFTKPGFLKATWNFVLIAQSPSQTILETETRIQGMDAMATRKFSLYWFVIKPFSGIIR